MGVGGVRAVGVGGEGAGCSQCPVAVAGGTLGS